MGDSNGSAWLIVGVLGVVGIVGIIGLLAFLSSIRSAPSYVPISPSYVQTPESIR
jgi:hypothetical protein